MIRGVGLRSPPMREKVGEGGAEERKGGKHAVFHTLYNHVRLQGLVLKVRSCFVHGESQRFFLVVVYAVHRFQQISRNLILLAQVLIKIARYNHLFLSSELSYEGFQLVCPAIAVL